MQSTRIDPELIAEYDNLTVAAWKSARSKRKQPEVRRFFERFETNLDLLVQAIQIGIILLGRYHCFKV